MPIHNLLNPFKVANNTPFTRVFTVTVPVLHYIFEVIILFCSNQPNYECKWHLANQQKKDIFQAMGIKITFKSQTEYYIIDHERKFQIKKV